MSVLTPRQLSVVRLQVLGLPDGPTEPTYAQMATHLGVSPKTIQSHLYAAHQRLNAWSAKEVALALGWGWPPDPGKVAA